MVWSNSAWPRSALAGRLFGGATAVARTPRPMAATRRTARGHPVGIFPNRCGTGQKRAMLLPWNALEMRRSESEVGFGQESLTLPCQKAAVHQTFRELWAVIA